MADDVKAMAKPQIPAGEDDHWQRSRGADVDAGGQRIAETGNATVVNVRVNPREDAPGTVARTMHT